MRGQGAYSLAQLVAASNTLANTTIAELKYRDILPAPKKKINKVLQYFYHDHSVEHQVTLSKFDKSDPVQVDLRDGMHFAVYLAAEAVALVVVAPGDDNKVLQKLKVCKEIE